MPSSKPEGNPRLAAVLGVGALLALALGVALFQSGLPDLIANFTFHGLDGLSNYKG